MSRIPLSGVLAATSATVAVLAACLAGCAGSTPGSSADGRTTPGSSDMVTYPVRIRRLPQRTLASGQARPGSRVKLALPCADEGGIVTSLKAQTGDELSVGTPVVAVQGRQVLAVPGEFPFYRDLESGMGGPDVRQLRAALVAAGMAVDSTGPVDTTLLTAVQRLQTAAGSWSSKAKISYCSLLTVPAGATVSRLRSLEVGRPGTDAIIEVNSGEPTAELEPHGEVGTWLKPGARFAGHLADSDKRVAGVVKHVGQAGGRDKVRVRLTTAPRIKGEAQIDGVLRPARSTDRGPIVPVAAIFAASDGRSFVQRAEGSNGSLQAPERVAVKTLASSGGWALVSGDLRDGDLLVVGLR